MARSKSSNRWLEEHFKDPYVKEAQRKGYRSRAVFKLLEIQEKDKILKPGMTVVDLGAAPGGWSELAVKRVGKKGKVFALDILPMVPVEGVEFIQGDFQEQAVLDELLAALGDSGVDLVISDMSPNISGIDVADQAKSMYLVELAFEFVQKVLKPNGAFLTKIYQGQGFDSLLKVLRGSFKTVMIRKPKASRARSKEIYLLAKGYKRGPVVPAEHSA